MANYRVHVTIGQSAGALATFSGGSIVVGRDMTNDLQVDDTKVSRTHLRFTHNGRDVILYDLNSTNGTTVNGRPVSQAVLRPGDVIGLGDSQLQFELDQAPTYQTSPPQQYAGQQHYSPNAPGQAHGQYPMQAAPRQPARAPSAQRSMSYPPRHDPYQNQPVARSSTNWGAILAAVLIICVIGGAAYWYYNNFMAQTPEQIAAEVARDWADNSLEQVAGQVTGLVPGASMFSGVLASQLQDRISWDHSPARCGASGRCLVTSTASAYGGDIRAPFILEIDTGSRRVIKSDFRYEQAVVAGISGGDVIDGASEVVDAFRSLSSDASIDRAVGGTIDTFRDIATDDNVDRAVDDTIDTFRDIATDDNVRSGIQSLFGN